MADVAHSVATSATTTFKVTSIFKEGYETHPACVQEQLWHTPQVDAVAPLVPRCFNEFAQEFCDKGSFGNCILAAQFMAHGLSCLLAALQVSAPEADRYPEEACSSTGSHKCKQGM